MIFGALMGAIIWNVVTWWGGIPSSSSHALDRRADWRGHGEGRHERHRLVGRAEDGGRNRAVADARLRAGAAARARGVLDLRATARHSLSTSFFALPQLGSAALYSLGHGGNDAQKTMGIIAGLLYAEGQLGSEFYVPLWVVLACQTAMALGTYLGGWRIVRTMGSRITRLNPMQGFCAEMGGAITLFLATWLGVPVSTTHTITGAIIGVGAARKVSAVRWNIAGSIVIAWIITLPITALIGAFFYACASQFG